MPEPKRPQRRRSSRGADADAHPPPRRNKKGAASSPSANKSKSARNDNNHNNGTLTSSSTRSSTPPPPRRDKPRASSGRDRGRRDGDGLTKSRERGQRRRQDGKSKSRDGRSKSRRRSSPPSGRDKSRSDRRSRSRPKAPKAPQANETRSGGGGRKGKGKGKARSSARVADAGPPRRRSAKARAKFAGQAEAAIPATVRMISGSRDAQTSADVGNVESKFELPDPAGRSGGACTAALLQALYRAHESGRDDMTWVDVLEEMRTALDDRGFEQVPQLTSSRTIDVSDPFLVVPEDFDPRKNAKRAVLVGINYEGQSGELSGCHNDVRNVAKYLRDVQGFEDENVTILMDDGRHKAPTRAAMLNAYKRLVRTSKEGDVVFCHYSGHGGRLRDDDGDEDDGHDETLIPADFKKAGQIRDDDLLKALVRPMPKGVTVTCLMDCCHSGTVLDLPYQFVADGDREEMDINEKCDFKDALWTGAGVALGAAAAGAAAAAATPQPEMMILGGGPNAIHEYSDTACCVVS